MYMFNNSNIYQYKMIEVLGLIIYIYIIPGI